MSNYKNMTNRKLYELCRKYGSNAKMWTKRFADLLPEVEKRKLYKKYKCYSIYEFAAKLAGIKKDTVDEILRICKQLEDKPHLRAQMKKQGWSKLKVVASIATKENEEELAEKVEILPKRALEEWKREIGSERMLEQDNERSAISGQDFRPGSEIQPETKLQKNTEVKFEPRWTQISFKIDPETELKLRKYQKKLEKEQKETVSLNEVLKTLLKKTENPKPAPTKTHKPRKPKPELQAKKPRKPKSPIKITRYIPAEIKRKLPCKCQFKNCNKPAEVYHHPERWALTKNHNKVVVLCHEHHHIAHAGLIENEHEPPEKWRIGAKPDKTSPKFRIDQKFQRKLLKI